MILSQRNRCPKRNRLEAARVIAKLVPQMKAVQNALKQDSVYLDWDAYNFSQAWVWKHGQFTGLLLEIRNGRMCTGVGDGYHRAIDERAKKVSIHNSAGIRKKIKEALAVLKEEYGSFCRTPYCERYETRHKELKKQLRADK